MHSLKYRLFGGISAAALLVGCVLPAAYAATIGKSLPAESLTRARLQQLPGKERAAWLDYLTRSEKQRALDKKTFQEELNKAGIKTPTDPPHYFSARSIPMDRATAWYATADARHIADVIVSYQTPAGGWSKNIEMSKEPRRPGVRYATNNLSQFLGKDDFDTPVEPDWNYVGTIDNDATITQMLFLAKVISATGTPEKDKAAYIKTYLHGMTYLFDAQFPNGGWPQVWPLEGGYHDAVTFNDDAISGAMEVMHNSAEGKGDYAFVPKAVREKAAASFQRGVDCILAAQIVVNGKLTVWSQQVDPLTMKPVSGRNFEPASPCATESDDVMMILMNDIANPDARVQKAIYSAAEWFKATAIYGQSMERGPDGRMLEKKEGAGPIWARFYESGTNRPIFADRDKTIHDDMNELTKERRNGYQWYGSDPKEALERFEKWKVEHAKIVGI